MHSERLGICFLVLLALAIWYCKCRDRNRERQEEILTRQRMLIEQLRQEESATQPSRYHPDAPPAYDDVINKPEDYPIYEGNIALTASSRTPSNDAVQDTQTLPSYEEVIRMSGHFTDANVNVEHELGNMNNARHVMTSRTTDL